MGIHRLNKSERELRDEKIRLLYTELRLDQHVIAKRMGVSKTVVMDAVSKVRERRERDFFCFV